MSPIEVMKTFTLREATEAHRHLRRAETRQRCFWATLLGTTDRDLERKEIFKLDLEEYGDPEMLEDSKILEALNGKRT